MSSYRLQFIEMYQASGVLPLYSDLEAGQVYTKVLDKIGFYGDKNYLFYYKDGIGGAFYEKEEMEKEAESGFRYFSNEKKFKKYVLEVNKIIKKIAAFNKRIKGIQVEEVDKEKLISLFEEKNELYQAVFTYFNVSQPQVVSKFEEIIRQYLKTKVSGQEVDSILSTLSLSEKRTAVSKEELGWLQIVKYGKQKNILEVNSNDIQIIHPDLYKKFLKHFEDFKLFMVGENTWNPKLIDLVDRYQNDINLDMGEINMRIEKIKDFPKRTKKDKQQIAKRLNIEESIHKIFSILAEIGYLRLQLRLDGFIPLVYFAYKIEAELGRRSGMEEDTLPWATKRELRLFLHHKKGVRKGVLEERKRSNEYLLWIDEGEIKVLYGKDAGQKFNELVKIDEVSFMDSVKGNVAMPGKVRGKVCVYHWGDDLNERLEFIRDNQILVAGQTRLHLMPLIRQAKAIVTDEGGIISHAAIISRELGIPCIVGTKIATQVLKDGDLVEVDANLGTVKILKR